MKTKVIILIAALLAIGKVSAQPYADKDGQPNATRNQNLQQQFSFSQEQIERYNNALAEEAAKLNDLYAKPINRTEIDKQEKIIYEDFKNQVKQILDTYQYIKWEKANPNNKTRRYREYLGLDNIGILKLEKIIATYKASIKSIYVGPKLYTNLERIELKANIYAKRNEALTELIGTSNVDEFNRYYDVYRQARIMHKGWPSLSFNDVKKLAALRLQFENNRNVILCSDMSENLIKKKVSSLKKEYYDSVKNAFSPEVYAKFINDSDARADFITRRNYKMTKAQLDKYKDAMNNRAVKRMAVRKSSLSKGDKHAKYDEINTETRTQLSKFLSAEQVDVWWRNLHKQR